jgi:glycosyltransferase involved in cell wall biosynthesis
MTRATKRSVLLLCEYATLNGGEQSMLSTLDGITRAGYDVRVAAPASGPLAAALRQEAIEVVPFEPRDVRGVRLPLDELRGNLAEILRRHRGVLLHANSLAMGRLAGPVAAELSFRSLTHLRDIMTLSDRATADLNCHARLLAVSNATRQFHVSQGLAADKTFVFYNGVDLDRFDSLPPTGYLHGELGLAADTPLIGTIGQISLRKGHDVLAAALSTIPLDLRFAWLIVGQRFSSKEESRQFETKLHQAAVGPLAGKMHFLGMREDLPRILNELTILVHPARQEPLGRVLLEAAAARLPIVATDVGGTREIFPRDREAACLVPPDDIQAMSVAVTRLLCNAALRRQLGLNARRQVEEAFGLPRAVSGLLKHYDELTG